MIDKKTFVLAVAVSWALTLVTVLLISNFAPSLTQPFTQQFTESNNLKLVTFNKQEVQNVSETNDAALYYNFTWTPDNPNKNSILAIVFTFEYSVDKLSLAFWDNRTNVGWFLSSLIRINENSFGSGYFEKMARNQSEWNQQWSSEWEEATYQTHVNDEPRSVMPQNQNHYQIQLSFYHSPTEVSTYIRHVNLSLLVIDG